MSPTSAATALPPIVKSIEVHRPLDEAFRLFTAEMARWWPLASHSVGGDAAHWCGIEGHVGGRVFERTRAGDEHVWGMVTEWQPPHRLAFTWHPGQASEPHTEVVIRFTAIPGDRTQVVLEHRGWDAIGARGEKVHGQYAHGWDFVLGERFAGFAE